MVQYVIIDSVRCIDQDDLTGSDTIYALNGGARYPIGTLKKGDVISKLGLQIIVVEDSPISIYEHDDVSDDDYVGDLYTREFGPITKQIGNGSATYEFEYSVA